MFAVHCDWLGLGIGETESAALRDARAHDADTDLCDTCFIARDAADYVRKGGDCRALRVTLDAAGLDVLVLCPKPRAPAPARPHACHANL